MVEIIEMVEIKDTSDERTYDQPNFEWQTKSVRQSINQ